MITVDPRGLSPAEWCDYTADNLAGVTHPMKVGSDDDWPRFGDYMAASLRRRGAIVPDPAQFDDFEKWASRFNQVISTLEL